MIDFHGIDFAVAWEQRKGKLLFKTYADKGFPELPVLMATQEFGMIRRSEQKINIIHDRQNEIGYKRVLPGQFVIHLRSFQGGFAYSELEGITSPAYTVFGLADPTHHYDLFWKYIFNSPRFIERLKWVTYGIRDGKSISYKDFSELSLSFPDYEEQLKIGDLLQKVDALITLHQRKCDFLTHLKETLLTKLFPIPGEKIPELRFPGFTEVWEQRKLSEICKSFAYGLNAAAKDYDGKNKYLRITDIDEQSRSFSQTNLTSPDVNIEESQNYKLEDGDLLFARTGASVGKTYIYRPSDGDVYYAGYLIRAKVNKGFDPEFIFQATLTNTYAKFIKTTSQRSGQPGVNSKEYGSFVVSCPIYDEQLKIGEFFRSIDNLITLHQRKLFFFQELKQTLLNKMFV